MKEQQLKPCPFCWGSADRGTVKYSDDTVRKQQWKQATFHYINCASCGASNVGLVGFETTRDAELAWNRREVSPAGAPNMIEKNAVDALSDGYSAVAVATQALIGTPDPALAETVLPIEIQGVADALQEGGGFWRSCSGCHESDEGVPTGPFSAVFKCHLGNGCADCGGIGSVWDTLDYQAMADEMVASMNAGPDDLDEGVQAIVTLLEAREWADLLPHRNPLVMRLWDAIAALHEQLHPAEPSYASGELNAPCLPPLNKELIEILGRPNFTCIGLAELLRAGGHQIARKSEHEQAASIHLLLSEYLADPQRWAENVKRKLIAMAANKEKTNG